MPLQTTPTNTVQNMPVNDDNDEDFHSTKTNFIVDYPAEARAGAILEESRDGMETRFERIRRTQQKVGELVWVPFSSLADWELSQWLIQLGVSGVCLNSLLTIS